MQWPAPINGLGSPFWARSAAGGQYEPPSAMKPQPPQWFLGAWSVSGTLLTVFVTFAMVLPE
jgi:hypothetical protein